jgi:hypothetical protein
LHVLGSIFQGVGSLALAAILRDDSVLDEPSMLLAAAAATSLKLVRIFIRVLRGQHALLELVLEAILTTFHHIHIGIVGFKTVGGV